MRNRTEEMRDLREDMQRSIDRQDEIKEQIAELKNDREKERESMTILEGKLDKLLDEEWDSAVAEADL